MARKRRKLRGFDDPKNTLRCNRFDILRTAAPLRAADDTPCIDDRHDAGRLVRMPWQTTDVIGAGAATLTPVPVASLPARAMT